MLLEALPERIDRFLDLDTGDGWLLALIRSRHPDAQAIGVDISKPMLVPAEDRFNGDPLIDICAHDPRLRALVNGVV
jgi:trans-aconitate methyltransferase